MGKRTGLARVVPDQVGSIHAQDRPGRDVERGLCPLQELLLEVLLVVTSGHQLLVYVLYCGTTWRGTPNDELHRRLSEKFTTG